MQTGMLSSMKPTALTCLIVVLASLLLACGGSDSDDSAGDTGSTATTAPPATPAPAPAAPAKPKPPVAAAPAKPKRGSFVVGIGEQNSPMFADRRFRALGITHARLVAPYDTVARRGERDLADVWLGAAKAAGAEPFITFGHSRAKPAKLPSVAEFRAAFDAFHERYPEVKTYAPWNEINHTSQPTARAPQRAAEYYNVVKARCPDCTVLAGDVLDQAGMIGYVKRYRRHLDGEPAIWGLHNYADTNRFRTSGLRDLMRTVKGDIWLTETGGIVKFGRNFPRDEQRAARSVTFALKLARDNRRVKRVYLYNWTGAKPSDRFDSGLIGSDGAARPGYDALRAGLKG